MVREELGQLKEWLTTRRMSFTEDQLEALWTYGELLLKWNAKVNLISRKDEESVLLKHIGHCLTIAFFHSFRPQEKVLDLGTGGGLPGIPLAIFFPETHFLLLDSTGKKIAACADMISTLGIKNAIAKKGRAEELKGLSFDTVVSRQVAELSDLIRWSTPLLKEGGKLICLKGGNLDDEIDAALISAAERLAFPESIQRYPINDLGPRFEDKYVIVAS